MRVVHKCSFLAVMLRSRYTLKKTIQGDLTHGQAAYVSCCNVMQGSLSSDDIMQGSCGHAYALGNLLNL